MKNSLLLRVVIGLAAATALVLGPVAGASAADWAHYYGDADCSGTWRPTTISYGQGTVKHQISPSVGGGYYERSWNNGSVWVARGFQIAELNAAWATVSGVGPENNTAWSCQADSAYPNY